MQKKVQVNKAMKNLLVRLQKYQDSGFNEKVKEISKGRYISPEERKQIIIVYEIRLIWT